MRTCPRPLGRASRHSELAFPLDLPPHSCPSDCLLLRPFTSPHTPAPLPELSLPSGLLFRLGTYHHQLQLYIKVLGQTISGMVTSEKSFFFFPESSNISLILIHLKFHSNMSRYLRCSSPLHKHLNFRGSSSSELRKSSVISL